VQDAANALLRDGMRACGGCRCRGPARRTRPSTYDFLGSYVDDLPSVLDLDAVREAGVRIGADPLGGASVDYWGEIAERHRLDLTVVNPLVDPDLALHDAGLGRQDPHGLLVAVRHGLAHQRTRTRTPSPRATTPTPTATAS
jgi:phosphoglucomutase